MEPSAIRAKKSWRYVVLLQISVLAGLLLVALSSTAEASPFTSPAGTYYTSTIKAEAESPTILHNAIATLSCKASTIEGKVESHSTTTASGKVSNLTFGECTGGTVKVLKPGSLELHVNAGGTGTLTSSGAEITTEQFGISCLYTTSSTHLGTVTDSSLTGGNATLDILGATIPRTGHSHFCGEVGNLTGSYKVTTPGTLYLDSPSPLTSPAGTYYTSTIKAEAESPAILHNAVGTLSCKASTIEGKVESHSATTASGKVSSLTFGECTGGTVKVLKPGSLELHVNAGGTGTLTSSGAEITTEQFGISCLYTTSSTHLGTVTDSSLTGGNATLDIGSAAIPRTGHNFFCGKTGQLTGSYKLTTPSTLYLHSPSPLTSPAGTHYTSTIKAEAESGILLHHNFGILSCKASAIEGKVESHTATTVGGKASSLTFGECTGGTVKVLKPGSLELHVSAGGTGTLISSGAEITVEMASFKLNCVYRTANTHLGTVTDSSLTGANATLDIGSAAIPRTGHSFSCGGLGELTGSYKITTPSTLYLD